MLPEHLTTEIVRNVSDGLAKATVGRREMDAIDEVLNRHIEIVADEIAARANLNPYQAEELQERIVWRLELVALKDYEKQTKEKPMAIICLSDSYETYWSLSEQHCGKLASIPLAKMHAYVREHGESSPISSTEDVDLIIGTTDLTDQVEEDELRNELRSWGGQKTT